MRYCFFITFKAKIYSLSFFLHLKTRPKEPSPMDSRISKSLKQTSFPSMTICFLFLFSLIIAWLPTGLIWPLYSSSKLSKVSSGVLYSSESELCCSSILWAGWTTSPFSSSVIYLISFFSLLIIYSFNIWRFLSDSIAISLAIIGISIFSIEVYCSTNSIISLSLKLT